MQFWKELETRLRLVVPRQSEVSEEPSETSDSFDGNHQIDAEEFYSGLCEIQVQVTRAEANALMALFDTDGDGHVNFDEFLVGIRVSTPNSLVASFSL